MIAYSSVANRRDMFVLIARLDHQRFLMVELSFGHFFATLV